MASRKRRPRRERAGARRDGKSEFLARTHEVDRDLFEVVRRHQGSISAEHGSGLLEREWLSCSRTEAEVGLMRQLEAVLDPKGVLNPGKVLP